MKLSFGTRRDRGQDKETEKKNNKLKQVIPHNAKAK